MEVTTRSDNTVVSFFVVTIAGELYDAPWAHMDILKSCQRRFWGSRLWTPLTSALSLRRFTLHCALMTREGELEQVEISPRGVFNCKLIFAQLSK